MSLQITCPTCQNLLEVDESQMGQQCQCPLCAGLFLIPVLDIEPEEPAFDVGPGRRMFAAPDAAEPEAEESAPALGAQVTETVDVTSQQEDRVVRIRCPNKHELHTPMSMVGEEAMCPHCGEQFTLRYEDSVEYEREREVARRIKEERLGRKWLNWAIVVAVLVVILLIGVIVGSQ